MPNISNPLLDQANSRYIRHNRQGSKTTKDDYAKRWRAFLVFVYEVFELRKLKHIGYREVSAYVDYLVEEGRDEDYIRSILSVLRFWHDKMDDPKEYFPPDNDGFDLPARTKGGKNRAWTLQELEAMVRLCRENGRVDFADLLLLGYHLGLRIHEAFRLDVAGARAALRKGALKVKGKGGRVREVPLTPVGREVLQRRVAQAGQGHKPFVTPSQKTHSAIRALQDFIREHRASVQDKSEERPLVYHGLRYAYAQARLKDCLANGMTRNQALREVSELLGHSRKAIVLTYTGPVEVWPDIE